MTRSQTLSLITSIILDLLLIMVVSAVWDAGFWETLLWTHVFFTALWCLIAIRQIITLLVIGTGGSELTLFCKTLKDAGFAPPETWHDTWEQYFESVADNAECNAETRVKAAVFGAMTMLGGRHLTLPASLVRDRLNLKRLAFVRRELAIPIIQLKAV